MENLKEWVSREAVISHEDGYASYATVWFNGSEVVAIEPHTSPDWVTGECYYYNRIMGHEISEYEIDLYDEEYEMSEDELLIAAAVIEDNCEVEISLDWLQ